MLFRMLPKWISRRRPFSFNQVNFASTLIERKLSKEMLLFHNSLPKLPVPPLHAALERYLRSVRPLVTDEEYHNTCKIVKEFGAPGGIGVKLHADLLQKSKSTENWISKWWENHAYLSVRRSLLNYSTSGIYIDIEDFNAEENHLRYSAKIIAGLLNFKHSIDNLTTRDVDTMSGQSLDMTQCYDVFAACRIPGSPQDSHLLTYLDDKPPKHIIVTHNNHFFSCDVYNDQGESLNEEQILLQLKKVVQQSQLPEVPLGLLPSLDRDKWFKAYGSLLKNDAINEKSIKSIQKAMFILCLDKPATDKETPDRISLVLGDLMHGGGAERNSGNRWFDKALQVIVNRDGALGITMEHSIVDGQFFTRLIKHMLDYVKGSESSKRIDPALIKTFVPEPKKMEFNISKDSFQDIEDAKKDLKRIVDDLDISCRVFDKFGTDFIRSQKLNPDSFIQMALQLGFYKLHGEVGATYETASTRKFLLGRTDVIRSTSVESADFCKKMSDKSASSSCKAAALRKAIDIHKEYAYQASIGMAVDRLFLGLNQIALESGLGEPLFFQDAGYIKSTNYRISSSQVSFAPEVFGGYGVLVPDGYGCPYNPQPSHLRLTFTASNSCSKTKANNLSQAVVEALIEMRDVITH